METFFLLYGVTFFSWHICSFLFWLDNPKNHKQNGRA